MAGKQEQAPKAKSAGKDWKGRWTWIRRGIAVGLIAGSAALVIASHYDDSLASCDTKQVPGQPALESCQGFPVADLTPVFLLALLFLWPDLSEFEVAGLVRVVRRIDKRQVELEKGQERIERQLIQVSQTQNVIVNIDQRLGAAAAETKAAHAEVTVPSEDDPRLQAEFVETWDALEPWSSLATRLLDPSFAGPVKEALSRGANPAEAADLQPGDRELLSEVPLAEGADYDKLLAWALQARDRLELVRQARVLSPSAPPRTLKNAIVVARGLLRELDEAGLRRQG